MLTIAYINKDNKSQDSTIKEMAERFVKKWRRQDEEKQMKAKMKGKILINQ